MPLPMPLLIHVCCVRPETWQALYPVHFGVFVRASEEWSDSPEVTTSLMKFMMEFVYNKVSERASELSSQPAKYVGELHASARG